MSCPNVSALKKKVIKKVIDNFQILDKKKFPFELTKKKLTEEINKVKSKKFLNTLGAAKNSCAIRGGRYGKRGGGLLTWLLYIICVINQPDDFIDHVITDYPDCSELLFPNDVAVASPAAVPSVEPEIPVAAAAAAPSAAEDLPEAYARLPTPEEVDAMSPEEYTNYINSLGGGRRRRRRKSRKKRRKTKRKSHKKRRKTKKRGKKSRKKRGKGNAMKAAIVGTVVASAAAVSQDARNTARAMREAAAGENPSCDFNRRQLVRFHPDKGGTTEDSQYVNNAYNNYGKKCGRGRRKNKPKTGSERRRERTEREREERQKKAEEQQRKRSEQQQKSRERQERRNEERRKRQEDRNRRNKGRPQASETGNDMKNKGNQGNNAGKALATAAAASGLAAAAAAASRVRRKMGKPTTRQTKSSKPQRAPSSKNVKKTMKQRKPRRSAAAAPAQPRETYLQMRARKRSMMYPSPAASANSIHNAFY